MAYTPNLIAPFRSSLVKYYKPFLIGNDAFEEIENAYTYRGVVRKREGADLLAFMGSHANNLNVTVNVTAITQANPAAVTCAAAHSLVSGDIVTFVNVGGMTQINGLTSVITVTGATTFTCTDINSTTYTAYTAGASVALPVQGLKDHLITTSLDEDLIAFSRYKAYRFNVSTEVFDLISTYTDATRPAATPGVLNFTGTNLDFFWSVGYGNAMWVTNGVDPMHFLQSAPSLNTWNLQRPLVGPVDRINTCRMIIPYKGRLVILNTTEGAGNVRYRQRARWSQIGTPYVPDNGTDPIVTPPTPFALDANAWRSDIIGRGGFIDADTTEEIITATIINDTLVVFFERSTWRLRYTGNPILPFLWERVDLEYGSESKMAIVKHDNAAYTFSRFGFVAANTNDVARIDENIPDISFGVESGNTGEYLETVCTIKDYEKQLIYFAYPDADDVVTSPNKILAYNYIDKSFSIFNQSFRTFGHYKSFTDVTWAQLTQSWASRTVAWNAEALGDNFPQVVAGSTTGRVFIPYGNTNPGTDNGTNFNFSIKTKRFNPYLEQGLTCRLEYVDLYVTATNGGAITLDLFINNNDNTPAISRTVSTSLPQTARYTRVFLGEIANFHQIRLYLSDTQLADNTTGRALFELQGMTLWTRPGGHINDL